MPINENSMPSESMIFDSRDLKENELLYLYRLLLKPRMIEEKMLILLRQGRVSKWFSGIGQEAISVGCTAALKVDETIFTMHRNLGVFTTREVPINRLMGQWQGKASGYTKGRDRSFHFGSIEHHIVGMISHLGPQLSLATGVALAHRIRHEQKVSLAFTGEGATSQGEFHEAMNVAAVWSLPVIFAIENNGYGLSTPVEEQFAAEKLIDKAIGYGMEGYQIDGNNILDVYHSVKSIAEDLRQNPRPVMIEFKTFRIRGHEEASDTRYVPQELVEHWSKKDPLKTYENYLLEREIVSLQDIQDLREKIKLEIEQGVEEAFNLPEVDSDPAQELSDVYAPIDIQPTMPKEQTSEMRIVDSISDGLKESMRKYPELILMGQDIAEYGGVFKITDGFLDEFGKDRVRNTPLCESAIIGAALGLSLEGMKAMVEMQFADFVTCGFNQIVNNLAKINYRWNKNADVVIRMPCGGGIRAGPFHSQTNEAWFFKTPGLKIAYPSNPYDAKGLLIRSFEDPNPIMFFEHKALYRSIKGSVPDGYYSLPFGQAKIVRPGTQCSIVTYGPGVYWALEAIENTDIDAEIIDLRTLIPLDMLTIEESTRKTHRILILHEDTLTGGIGAEISARLCETVFPYLDAPIKRVGSLDTPVPFAARLESNFLPQERIKKAMADLLAY